ncbi:MAG TPA: SpoIID/LytB domain-containing protein [Herpetosiphonaceae bacterium]
MQRSFFRTLMLVVVGLSLAFQAVLVPSSPALAAPEGTTGMMLSARTPEGTPVEGAEVTVLPLGLKATTNGKGAAVFEDLALNEPVKVEVLVKARGYRPWIIRQATVIPNDTLQIDAPLSATREHQAEPEVIDVQPHRSESGAAQEPGPANPPLASEVGALATNTTPPSTIRVYRVSLGRIDTVNFNYYVKHVLPSEWISSWHAESLRAGAMAVKTYGWYWTIYSKYPGAGYDVKDTTADQVYNPNVSYASTDAATDANWGYKMTRNGAIFQAHYCAGSYNSSRTSGQCSENHGWTVGTYMSQWGSKWYADNGRTWQWMVPFYYDNVVVSTISSSTPIVVDDQSAGFTRYGPTQYWWEAAYGYNSHMWWTYSNVSTVSNYGRWKPSLSTGAGNYAVEVFIPNNYASSKSARYRIYHNGANNYATVDQSIYYNQWVPVGTFYFAANGTEYVELTDATGECVTCTYVGFDAVRFTKQ